MLLIKNIIVAYAKTIKFDTAIMCDTVQRDHTAYAKILFISTT